jgi:hypothetical protein
MFSGSCSCVLRRMWRLYIECVREPKRSERKRSSPTAPTANMVTQVAEHQGRVYAAGGFDGDGLASAAVEAYHVLDGPPFLSTTLHYTTLP